MRLRTVYGKQQWLILETIPTPRFQSYEAGHWSTERSKTPRRHPPSPSLHPLFPPCAPDSARPHAAYSTESMAGEHSRWSPTAEREGEKGSSAVCLAADELPPGDLRSTYGSRMRSALGDHRSVVGDHPADELPTGDLRILLAYALGICPRITSPTN